MVAGGAIARRRGGGLGYRRFAGRRAVRRRMVFNDTIQRFRFTREAWLPSSWLSRRADRRGAAQAGGAAAPVADTPVVGALMHLALLVSNALMGRLLLTGLGARIPTQGVQPTRMPAPPAARLGFDRWDRPRRRDGSAALPAFGPTAADQRLASAAPRPGPVVAVLDLLRPARPLLPERRSVQRSRAAADISYATWTNLVSFLNLAVVGLILSTFTTRFIYPMLSLEGRRFWVLGLMPVSRETIVWSKFVFAALGSLGDPCAAADPGERPDAHASIRWKRSSSTSSRRCCSARGWLRSRWGWAR